MAAAAVTAAGVVGSAALQYRASRRAAQDQKDATNRAIQMEKEEAERRRQAAEARRQQILNDRQLRFMNYYNRFGQAAIDRYGLPPGIDAGLFPAPNQGGGSNTRRVNPTPQPQTTRPGFLGGLMDSQQPNTNPSAMSNQPFNWNEWERYL